MIECSEGILYRIGGRFILGVLYDLCSRVFDVGIMNVGILWW